MGLRRPYDPETRRRLLALNRRFYDTVVEPFDQTRRAWPPGQRRLLALLPHGDAQRPLRVADIGCGNGRLACILASRGTPVDYVGLDANPALLALARAHCAGLPHVQARFVQADLAEAGWSAALNGDRRFDHYFDIVACLATLQHLPGFDLRAAAVREMAGLLAPDGLLVLSAWQFLTSERFVAKQVSWAEVGIDETQVEPGDALLPWAQGGYALRFVHQIDLAELTALAEAAGLALVEHYRADGKEGNLNLYALLQAAQPRAAPAVPPPEPSSNPEH
ncbi:MAG TPA: class I SAM-dependent methyltransferase [Caldilineaceae bacterium]|nr:class I SAM-dependent methyltransferase [Caldilineaceae bacterium]